MCPVLDTSVGAYERVSDDGDLDTNAAISTARRTTSLTTLVLSTTATMTTNPKPSLDNQPKQQSESTKFALCLWRLLRRKQCLVLLGLTALLILYVNSAPEIDISEEYFILLNYSHMPGMKEYVVWGENCKIPSIDPYQFEIMKNFERVLYEPCSNKKPLTRVIYNEKSQKYILEINNDSLGWYKIKCCYRSIHRDWTGAIADNGVSLSDCMGFEQSITLPTTIDNILVNCSVGKKEAYVNGHAMIPERRDIRERLEMWKRKDKNIGKNNSRSDQQAQRPLNVLMIGIDSISRVNLIRALPKTTRYMYDNEWFELSGYNKIDDNTFPNLMAVLTGRNLTTANLKCSPVKLGGLDNCPFIWNTFREHGYVTAYAEDDPEISTFNYEKLGFEKQPVDFYIRPFLIGAEQALQVKKRTGLVYCLGYQHSAEFIYNYAIEFMTRFKNDPFFGLFWTNTFTHNVIGDASAMDDLMVDYVKQFTGLNNTIVIFFSDHGIRFGPTRSTWSGHLEERLPFIFLSLPQDLKRKHPKFVNALSVNKNRLTNPYDLHMTLKHILAMTKRVKNKELLGPAEDCARCQTLLEPVPQNRSCEDIAIEEHWCTCIPYHRINKSLEIVHKATQFSIDHINGNVARSKHGFLCEPLKLFRIKNAFAQSRCHANKMRAATP